jgi:tetratricopeptide (TPR) repeat protein
MTSRVGWRLKGSHRESPGQTLEATASEHEAYLRSAGGDHQQRWDSPGHFVGAAAKAMRRILIERARHKRSVNRGDFEAAERRQRRAIELRPRFAEAHCNLGAVLIQRRRFDEAEASLRRALELKPNFVETQAPAAVGKSLR